MSSLLSTDQRRWIALPQDGVEVCSLHSHEDTREVAALLRMREGAGLPRHGHPGGEHMYVLEGSIRVAGQLVQAGDYHYTPADESHEVVAQEHSLVLSVLPKGLDPGGDPS